MAMPDETIWHEWDPFHQVLKIAFADREKISVFTYRLCPECGVSMDRADSADEMALWTCAICGCEVREVLRRWPRRSPLLLDLLFDDTQDRAPLDLNCALVDAQFRPFAVPLQFPVQPIGQYSRCNSLYKH